MKKLCLITLLFFADNLKAQTYTPLVQDSLVWQVNFSSLDDPWIPTYFYTFINYFTQGDTILNGKGYNKIYQCSSTLQFPDCNANSTNLLGYLREENKKVYFRKSLYQSNSFFSPYTYYKIGSDSLNDTTEYVLYDFNWLPGDTIYNDTSQINAQYKIVVDTASVVINNDNLKLLTPSSTTCGGNEKIIERIGSTFGLFGMYLYCFEGGSCLERFADLKTGFNYWPNFSPCYGVGIKEAAVDIGLSVFSSGQTIAIKQTQPGDYTYKLYNMNGSLLTSGNVTGTELQVNATPGIYLLSAVNSKGMVKTFKIALFE